MVFAAASALFSGSACVSLCVCLSPLSVSLSLSLLTLGGLTQTAPLLSKCSVSLSK